MAETTADILIDTIHKWGVRVVFGMPGAKRMRADGVGVLPVTSDGRLVGMVTDRDIAVRAVAAGRTGGTTAVSDVMSEDVFCALAEEDIDNAARVMAEHQVRHLPVLDRRDRLVGIVSLADIARVDPEITHHAFLQVTEPIDQPRR